MFAHKLFIFLFVVLSTAGEYYASITPSVLILDHEPIELTTTTEDLKHLVRMKKRADFNQDSNEKASDELKDLFAPKVDEKGLLGSENSLDKNDSSNGSGNSPDVSTATKNDAKNSNNDDLKDLTKEDDAFNPKAKNPNDDLLYTDQLKKTEEDAKNKQSVPKDKSSVDDSSSSSNVGGPDSSNDKSNDDNKLNDNKSNENKSNDNKSNDNNKSNDQNSNGENSTGEKSNQSNDKSNDQNSEHHSTVPSSTSSSKIIETLKPASSNVHPKDVRGKDGVDSKREDGPIPINSNSSASVNRPLFNLFAIFAIIWFLF